MFRFILRLFASNHQGGGAKHQKSIDVLIGRDYKRFEPGTSVICIDAPWHTGTMACEPCMRGIGPSKHSMVTVDRYLEERYVKFREFPEIVVHGTKKDPGYLDTFFVDADEINISELKNVLGYGND